MQENVDKNTAESCPPELECLQSETLSVKRPAGISRFLVWGGRLFSWGCVFFILVKMGELWTKFGNFRISPSDLLQLGIIVILGSAVSYGYCYMWGKTLECLSGTVLHFTVLAHLYAKSNLAKYLPGNVMHYVSRSVLAKKYCIPLQTTFLASLLDALLCAFSALLFAGVSLRRDIFVLIDSSRKYFWIAGLVFGAALLVACWALKRAGLSGALKSENCSVRKLSGAAFQNAALYFVYYLIMSCIFYRLLLIVGAGASVPFEFPAFWKTAGLYTLAWLTGFLVPGASGGIGVREAMLLTLLSASFSQETILASAFLLRILNVFSEIFAYLFSLCLLRKK
jgi:uncharacterized membrane protein YbhN (UPF0104 family)